MATKKLRRPKPPIRLLNSYIMETSIFSIYALPIYYLNEDMCFGNSVELALDDNEDLESFDKSEGRGRKRGFRSPAEKKRRMETNEAKRINCSLQILMRMVRR